MAKPSKIDKLLVYNEQSINDAVFQEQESLRFFPIDNDMRMMGMWMWTKIRVKCETYIEWTERNNVSPTGIAQVGREKEWVK